MAKVAGAGLSVAMFAPGWCLECGEAKGLTAEAAAPHGAAYWDAMDVRRIRESA